MLNSIRDWLFHAGYCAIGPVITILALVISDLMWVEQRWFVVIVFVSLLVPLTQYFIFTKHPATLKDFTNFLAKLTLKGFLLFAAIEEAVFRLVLLYYVLIPQVGELLAILLSSVTFGVYHFERYFFLSTYQTQTRTIIALSTVVITFIIGSALAWIFMRLITFSAIIAFLVVSLIHGIYNFTAFQKLRKYWPTFLFVHPDRLELHHFLHFDLRKISSEQAYFYVSPG